MADLHRLAVATAMTALDITIVSVALPTIRGDLGLDQLQLQWVVNAYLLVVAAGLGIAGRLADMLDRTWILRIGIVVFVGASLLAGLAQDPAWLIFARALQGAGYALLIPVSLALLLGAFGPDSSGRAMGLYYATVLAFTVLGPLIGGVLVEIEWRAIFFVNVPVGAAALVLISLGAGGARTPRHGRMDWTGAGLLSGGIVALVIGFMQAGAWDWAAAATLGALGLGVVLLGAFWIVESRTAAAPARAASGSRGGGTLATKGRM